MPALTSITLGNPSLDFREKDSFFYVGDDWKLTNHLTLNLGLTYSYYGQPANLFHNNDTKQQTSGTPFWDPALPPFGNHIPQHSCADEQLGAQASDLLTRPVGAGGCSVRTRPSSVADTG